jgi:hypothetical protein
MKAVDLGGLVALEDFLDDAPDIARRSMSYAMNDVLEGPGLAQYRKGITDQVNFPAGYVNDDRLGVTRRSTPNSLEAHVVGRQRPTSLARFASGGSVGGKGGVTVNISKKGGSSMMRNAFLVNLKAGDREDGNIGLAIRLAPGMTLNKKDTSRMVRFDTNVVLLYGPSIDQVLRNSVVESETPGVVTQITTEFYRQFARMS